MGTKCPDNLQILAKINFQNGRDCVGFLPKRINKIFHSSYIMGKFGTIKEIFELFTIRRKFYMFPIVILLIAMIGLTALAQTGLIAFIYPI